MDNYFIFTLKCLRDFSIYMSHGVFLGLEDHVGIVTFSICKVIIIIVLYIHILHNNLLGVKWPLKRNLFHTSTVQLPYNHYIVE